MGKLFFLSLFLFFSVSVNLHAQNEGVEPDSISIEGEEQGPTYEGGDKTIRELVQDNDQDTIILVQKDLPDPIKAALLSAALPGLGQIYNENYWKVPIVYGGLMTFGYLVYYFDYNYIKFRNAYFAKEDGNPNTINPYENDPRISDRLLNRVEFYRRNRDYLMILTAGFYFLNILEAHVDAHLQSFDINEDISMNIQPSIIASPFSTQIGLSLNFTIK